MMETFPWTINNKLSISILFGWENAHDISVQIELKLSLRLKNYSSARLLECFHLMHDPRNRIQWTIMTVHLIDWKILMNVQVPFDRWTIFSVSHASDAIRYSGFINCKEAREKMKPRVKALENDFNR